MTSEASDEGGEPLEGGGERPFSIFINWRHDDSLGSAGRLYDRLAPHFGKENVFLDDESLPEKGGNWLNVIRSAPSTSGAFIAVVGRRWGEELKRRDPEKDFVRLEIEMALRGDSRVADIIPVLVDGASLPGESEMPRDLRRLLDWQSVELRGNRFDDDVKSLIARIERARAHPPKPPPRPTQTPTTRKRPAKAGPLAEHFEELLQLIDDETDTVVPFVGPGVNSIDRGDEPWGGVHCNPPELPDAEDLATYLAAKLQSHASDVIEAPEPVDLAQVSQTLSVLRGSRDVVYKALERALPRNCPPTTVHKMLARIPRLLAESGCPDPYQMIVTTNYDDALERAFKEEGDGEYDLAIYVASGNGKGGFIHTTDSGEVGPAEPANEYDKFPLDEDEHFERPVIVKIHGGTEPGSFALDHKHNYVVTEDDYIGYMSDRPIGDIVPLQLKEKLLSAHFLFLGHTMRDWNLRIFLKRLFPSGRLNRSWAVQRRAPDDRDDEFWQSMGVELLPGLLGEYMTELEAYLDPADAG